MFNLRKLDKMEHRLVYLGAGHHRMKGFIHVELNLGKNKSGLPDVLADISEYIPLPDNSVDLVYSVATLEHLTYRELINCFLESRRILKRGGVVRMVVPNFDKYVKDYVEKKMGTPEKPLPDFPIDKDSYTDSFIFKMAYFDHRYLHNFDTMSRALKKAGFDEARVCVNGYSRIVAANEELFKTEAGRVDDIIIEATKLDSAPIAKMTPKNYPSNLILRFVAKFFNIQITSFKHREAHFPQRYWLVGVFIKARQAFWRLGRKVRPYVKFLYEK